MLNRIIKLSILFVLLIAGYNTASASFKINRPSTNNLGLVGHWTFDGKNVVNGVALDSSGSGNNAQLINIATSTFYSTGKIGQGFNFDGTNDYVGLTRTNNNEMSVSAWFYKDANNFSTSVSVPIFGSQYYNADVQLREGFDLKFETLAMTCGTNTAGYLCLNLVLITTNGTTRTQKNSIFNVGSISANGTSTQEWFYTVATYNSTDGSQRLYVNGVLRDTDLHTAGNTIVPFTTTTGNACLVRNKQHIGASCVNTSYFDGKIDDVRLYNRALSAGEVKNLYNQGVSKFNKTPTNILTNGLVGHWTFDGKNVVNGVALDSSGNGYNGNLINIATSTFYSTGKIGQGFNFDGTNDYASTTRINNNEITVSAWYYKNINDWSGSNNSDTVFGSWYWNANTQLQEGFDLKAGHTPAQTCGTPSGSGYLCAAFILVSTNGTTKTQKSSVFNVGSISKNATSTEEWFHIAGTYNSTDGNQRLYINGVLRDTDLHVAGNTVVALATTTAGACYMKMNIGYGCVNNGWFNGKIDDVRLYNRALSAGEIKMLYNMGR